MDCDGRLARQVLGHDGLDASLQVVVAAHVLRRQFQPLRPVSARVEHIERHRLVDQLDHFEHQPPRLLPCPLQGALLHPQFDLGDHLAAVEGEARCLRSRCLEDGRRRGLAVEHAEQEGDERGRAGVRRRDEEADLLLAVALDGDLVVHDLQQVALARHLLRFGVEFLHHDGPAPGPYGRRKLRHRAV